MYSTTSWNEQPIHKTGLIPRCLLTFAILAVSSWQFFITLSSENGAPHQKQRGHQFDSSSEMVGYCGYCPYDIKNTCDGQLDIVRKDYSSKKDARESLLPTCSFNEATEPFVLLHVGPHKTGTTAIQSFIYDSIYHTKTYLVDDNFIAPQYEVMPGRFTKEGTALNFAHCMIRRFTKDGGEMSQQRCNDMRAVLPSFLQRTYNDGNNIILVAEDLDRSTIDHQRILYYLRPYKRVKVVVSYRRLHEWLPSFYNQIVDLYAQNYIQNETKFPSFVEWVESEFANFLNVHTFAVAERYRSSGRFESVELINMHDTNVSLIENLFCILLNASSTCREIHNGIKISNPNKGHSHEYLRLCTEAYLRGKIKKLSKNTARKIEKNIISSRKFVNGIQFPLICLNQSLLEHMLETEKEQEAKYFPQWFLENRGNNSVSIAFQMAKQGLCSMDVEQILDSGILDDIFAKY
eukprot:scaffold16876_cov23-Cyclotella_meneghiniana.AAC.1